MQINKLTVGSLATNCYIMSNEETKTCFIVDPGAQAERILAKVKELDCSVEAILLTHGHVDHIMAAKEMKVACNCQIYAGAKEVEVLNSTEKNLTEMFGTPATLQADVLVHAGQKLKLADFSLEVLETPGHTEGGVTYYLPDYQVAFCGDTIFQESVGRTDFPTGSSAILRQSIQEQIFSLPDETKLLSGHGVVTTVAYEKQYNPFVV